MGELRSTFFRLLECPETEKFGCSFQLKSSRCSAEAITQTSRSNAGDCRVNNIVRVPYTYGQVDIKVGALLEDRIIYLKSAIGSHIILRTILNRSVPYRYGTDPSTVQ